MYYNFFLIVGQDMRYGGKGGKEILYIPMIRSQSFSEPMPLDSELKCCSVPLPSLTLDGTGWLEETRVGYFPLTGSVML